MASGNEYEPRDSRNVTGSANTPDARWSGDAPDAGHGGEYEPGDSRNVTGATSTEDGRWTNDKDDPGAGAGLTDSGGHAQPPVPGTVTSPDQE